MSKPLLHAKSSARRYGGVWQDYISIHDMMDSSKAHIADNRHRCYFHSSFGIYVIEKIFGTAIKNSDGKDVSVRSIAEDHVVEDLGVIPTFQDYLENMELQPWMQRATKENCPPSAKEVMSKRKKYKRLVGKD